MRTSAVASSSGIGTGVGESCADSEESSSTKRGEPSRSLGRMFTPSAWPTGHREKRDKVCARGVVRTQGELLTPA